MQVREKYSSTVTLASALADRALGHPRVVGSGCGLAGAAVATAAARRMRRVSCIEASTSLSPLCAPVPAGASSGIAATGLANGRTQRGKRVRARVRPARPGGVDRAMGEVRGAAGGCESRARVLDESQLLCHRPRRDAG